MFTFRQRCHDRLANNRQNFLERFRQLKHNPEEEDLSQLSIRDLMLAEWNVFQKEIQQSTSSQGFDSVSNKITLYQITFSFTVKYNDFIINALRNAEFDNYLDFFVS